MKQMSLIEMDGFLKGKCIPRDLKVNETNAEYLVRKFGELESKLNEQREYYEGVIADGSKRIAELSASHSKLRDTMAGIHNTIRMDGGYTPLAAILNAAKRAYEESASSAGIKEESE
ncbi:hypothetical protein RX589_000686 [Escherichia coli]|nr:hypothetical protein [Escherichia coli]